MGGPSNPPFMDPEDSLFKHPIHVLYLSLIVAIAITIVLAFYHLICTKWFQLGFLTSYPPVQRSSGMPEAVSGWMWCRRTNPSFLPSFKYEKDGMESDGECSVCLSVFEQGEELRQLPNCNHNFHAACIDMWLYSHMDCPLCRSPVKFRASQLRLMNSDASV